MDYKEASEHLGKRSRRKLANHTYLERIPFSSPVIDSNGPGVITVRLHNTNIIIYYPKRTVLDTGSWQTMTTRDRLNRYMPAPFSIVQDKGIWYVHQDGWQGPRLCVFKDGLTITHASKILHGGKIGQTDKKVAALRRKVAKYAKAFITALQAGKVPAPSNGDCWHCLMTVTSPEADKGKRLGEAGGGKGDHILSHIKENYFVPSLLTRAMEKAGCGPAWLWGLQAKWEGKRDLDKWHLSQFARWIRRYCYEQLELAR